MSHLWSGRFSDAPDRGVFEFQASLEFDRRLFEDDVRGSLAWAEALEAAGVLSRQDAARIAAALTEILDSGRHDPGFVTGSDEDVHAFVERQLIERIGETGKRLHTGRSRNEQVSLDLRLYLRRRVPELQAVLTTLVAGLAQQAAAAGPALMPAYTHLRRAQPVLVSHFFCRTRRPCGATMSASTTYSRRPMRSRWGREPWPVPATPSIRRRWQRDWDSREWRQTSIDAAADRDFVRLVSMPVRSRWCT